MKCINVFILICTGIGTGVSFAGLTPEELDMLKQRQVVAYERMKSLNVSSRDAMRNYQVISSVRTNDLLKIRGTLASNAYEFVYLWQSSNLVKEVIETNQMGVGLYASYYADGKPNRFIQLPSGLNLKFNKNGLIQEYFSVSNGYRYGLGCLFDEEGKLIFRKFYAQPEPISFSF